MMGHSAGGAELLHELERSRQHRARLSESGQQRRGLEQHRAGLPAGGNLISGSYHIDIGNQGPAGEGNTIRVSDANQSNTCISGILGTTITGGTAVLVDSGGRLGTALSSIRFKRDVAEMGEAPSRVMHLRSVTFHYRSQPDGPVRYGLVAEEVEKAMPELVVRDATGQVESVACQEPRAVLLNELQKQRATIESQWTLITALRAAQEAQQARMASLERRLVALEN